MIKILGGIMLLSSVSININYTIQYFNLACCWAKMLKTPQSFLFVFYINDQTSLGQ